MFRFVFDLELRRIQVQVHLKVNDKVIQVWIERTFQTEQRNYKGISKVGEANEWVNQIGGMQKSSDAIRMCTK